MLTPPAAKPKGLLALLILSTLAAASETDGGHAPARRWTHPRGPASGSARTMARAPETFGGITWRYRARESILAPPVTWDGIAFIIDGKNLIALDTATGDVRGRIRVDVKSPRPAVHDSSVFLREGDNLVQFRHDGKRFRRRWTLQVGPDAGHPKILDGEIYLPTAKGLLRLRAGVRTPAWTAEGSYRGEPAVFKDHVYALVDIGGRVVLAMHTRADGTKVSETPVGDGARNGGRVMMADGIGAVLLPPHSERMWAIVAADGKSVKATGKTKLLTQPMGGKGMLLALDANKHWVIVRHKRTQTLTHSKARPDLVAGAPSSVFLRDLVCFGTWLADPNANRIFWHLSEREDVTDFAKGLHWNAVPSGDHQLLVVPRGAKSLCAIGPEEIPGDKQ